MLLELAVGDAYGAGFEYADEMISHNNLSRYVRHPRHNLKPGCYTDDTQMSLAIAQLLIEGKPWMELEVANAFMDVFQRDPRPGYSRKFYQFLQTVSDGEDFLHRATWISDGSGAAMRSPPIGILPQLETVIEYTQIQAAVTHKAKAGIDAAVAAALMSHYFIYQLGKKQNLGLFLDTYVPGYHWSQPWTGRAKSTGWICVKAAVTALQKNDKLSTLLQDCIAFTGDVDTIAAMALAAGSCSFEIEWDLPENLIQDLENDAWGRDYIIALDRQLLHLANRG